jgi:hypothetical protein
MKTVNSIIILLFMTLLSCNKKRDIDSKKTDINSQVYAIISNKYNPDSIFYNIDVEWNENGVQEELFLITKNITVADSLFGAANNNKNWERAWKYMKKKYPEMGCPNFTYSLSVYDNRKFNEFASIVYDGRDITFPSLRQGEFSNLNSSALMGKYKKIAISNFLRIMEISNDNLDTKSINLIYKNKKWIVISKEILSHNYQLKYCIDTTNNDFSLKKMNIHYVFDYPQSNFNCK